MYEKVFQLDTRPFISTPDASRFFSAAAIHESLSLACSAIERASGTTIVIGPTGSGKTLFLKMLEEQFSSVYKIVNLACARLTTRTELLQNIMFELGQPYKGMSEGELRLGLIDYLKPGDHCPNGILLLVDEAQMLPAVLLDEIRLLTSLVRDGQPRAQLVLAGGYKLEEVLMDPSLESFNQRIAARCYLENFSQSETFQFVRNAVVNAGGVADQPIFTEKALHAVHKHTQGCPRQINQVCDYAMILAATANSLTIDVDCVHEAWADVQSLPNQWTCTKSKAQTSPGERATPVPLESGETIEFGELQNSPNLNDDSKIDFSETTHKEQKEDLRPLSSFTHEELAQAPTGQDEKWTEIEFGSLLPEESEELNTASSYEDSDEQETVLEFGQLEEEVEYPAKKQTSNLAEPIEPTEVDTANQPNEREIEDDRFNDLARFLAAPTLPASSYLSSGLVESSDNRQATPVQKKHLEDVPMATPVGKSREFSNDLEDDFKDELKQELQKESNDWQLEIRDPDAKPTLGIVLPESDYTTETIAKDPIEQTGWPETIYDEEESSSIEETMPVAESHPDLFADTFDQEEVVYDPYAELFSRQNKESLHITREQLNILDSMVVVEPKNVEPAAELNEVSTPEISDVEHAAPEAEQAEAEQADEEQSDETLEHTTVPFQLDTTDEQVASSESQEETKQAIDENELLRSIQVQQEEIASQIYKLKMDFSEVEIETSEIETSEIETSDIDTDDSPQNDHEQPVTEYPFIPHQFADSDDDDDKDLLIIQRQDRIESPQPEEEHDTERVKKISKGRAIRMEYRELFNQLRAAE